MGKLFGPQDELAEQKSKILIEQVNPFSGAMDLHELVRRVREGDSAKWQTTSHEMAVVASGNEQAANAGQEMLQALESSWSGEGADAASQAIRSSIKVTQDASDVYQRNSDHFTTNSGQFEDIKNRLPDVPAKPPETGIVDTITPWDTDAEDKANQYKADVDAARSMYSGYEGNVHRSAYDMQADFGQIKDLGGEFGSMERDRSGSVEDSGSGVIDIPGSDGGGDSGRPGTYDGSVGGSDRSGITSVPPGGGYQSSNPSNPSHVPTAPSPSNDNTGTSGYTPPSTVTPPAANYPGPNGPGGGMPGGTGFGPHGNTPGTTGFGNTGFGPTGTPGAGPGGSSGGGTGGGRFSPPGMGRAGGYSAGAGGGAGGYSAGGGAPGSGGSAPGAGRMTGASPGGFGPAGSGGAAAAGGGSAAGAAGGRGGMMGGMGGAGRGGQGGEDEEHQRKYLADSDEAFSLTEDGEVLRDPVTGHVVTPPTIGE